MDGMIKAYHQDIKLHTPAAFVGMRKAGQVAADTLDYITPFVTPGATTKHLDQLCHEYILGRGAVPAPLNYRGFPKSICTSLNHVVCHGIPGERSMCDKQSIHSIDINYCTTVHITYLSDWTFPLLPHTSS